MRLRELRVYATSPRHRRRVTEALQIVEDLPAKQCVVSFSGGKDSTAMLDLVRRVRPDTLAVVGDDEYTLPETERLLAATPNLVRVAAPVKHCEWFTAWGDTRPAEEDVEWAEDGLTAWLLERGYDGVFLGLRAEENNYRRVLLRDRGPIYWSSRHQQTFCCPLILWTTQDVWAYIVTHDLPYSRAYDRLEELGVPERGQRIGPIANERAIGWGSLAVLRRGWPQVYQRFVEAHPEARRYV